ncbi:hypothetical protein AB0G71_08725 [Streptomyces sp. NPDC020403]|uniref:hypothetical protein n=1 Tax=unclassified Streptomyces TaxID=2593676 RepID=UPI0034102EFF
MSEKEKAACARKTGTDVRPGPRDIPGDVLPARSARANTPEKTIRTQPRRPVSTVSVSAMFL